jgi:CysZ protein
MLMVAVPLMALVFSAFTYALVCLVVAGPLYERLSSAVEKELRGAVQEEPFRFRNVAADFARALALAALLLMAELAVLLFGLLFVPVTTVLAFLASALLLSVEYLDYPMGRRRMSTAARVRFVRRHAWALLGFGLPLLAGLMVPLVGVLTLPGGVAGGTTLFLRLSEAEAEEQCGGRRPQR